MVKDRNRQGRFTPEHTDETFLAAVRAHEPAATSEVADEVGVTRQAADYRLRKLRDAGRVNSKKIAASLVWFAPNATGSRERAVTPSEANTVDTTTESETPSARPPAAAGGDVGSHASSDAPETAPIETDQDLVDALRDWFEEGDHPPKTAHARNAVIGVFTLLREHGTLSTGELKERVYERHSEHYADKKPMWDSFSPYLTDVPGIEKAGYGKFGYAGDDATRDTLKDD